MSPSHGFLLVVKDLCCSLRPSSETREKIAKWEQLNKDIRKNPALYETYQNYRDALTTVLNEMEPLSVRKAAGKPLSYIVFERPALVTCADLGRLTGAIDQLAQKPNTKFGLLNLLFAPLQSYCMIMFTRGERLPLMLHDKIEDYAADKENNTLHWNGKTLCSLALPRLPQAVFRPGLEPTP